MEEAVYGDVLDVLVELREAVQRVSEASSDANTQSAAPAEQICYEQSPTFLEKLNGVVKSLEAVLPQLAAAASPPVTAMALRTLVTRKLGDVMESAHHVRSLALQAGAGAGTSTSENLSMMSTSSTASSEHRASEVRKARQVFRTASQNLDDAQRLLRIAYAPILSPNPAAPTSEANTHELPSSSHNRPVIPSTSGTRAPPPSSAAGGTTVAADEPVRYSINSNRSGTGTTTDTSPARGDFGDDDDEIGMSSAPRTSSHTAPYARRSESRELTSVPRGTTTATTTTSGGGSLCSSVLQDGTLNDRAGEGVPQRPSWGSTPSSAEDPLVATRAEGGSPVTAPPSTTRGPATQWWFESVNSSSSSSLRPTPTNRPMGKPTGRGSGAGKTERKVSFSSAHDMEEEDDEDEDEDGGVPLAKDATLRYTAEDGPNSASATGAPMLDLAYFKASSPTAVSTKASAAAVKGQAPSGLPPKPPASLTSPPSQGLATGGRHSPRGSPKPGESLLSPPSKPIVNSDGTHTTRHAPRLPGALWNRIIADDVVGLTSALKTDVMDLFNYGEETPQIYADNITDITFSHLEGTLLMSFALTHKASLTGADIDLRLGIFAFPEMTALYEDYFLDVRRREVAGEASEHEAEESRDASAGEFETAHMQAALADYHWPASEASTPSAGRFAGQSTTSSAALGGGRRSSDSGVHYTNHGPRRNSEAGPESNSSTSDRTLSLIPENSPMASLTPTSAAALRRYQQQQQQQPQSLTPVTQSSHHSITIPGPHWDRVVLQISERVCRLLVVDEIASALGLPSTAVEHVDFRFGSLCVDFDLYAGPGETLPPPELVNKVMAQSSFPIMMRVYTDTCMQLKLNPDDTDEDVRRNEAALRQAGIQFTLPDKEELDMESDEDSVRRKRAVAAATRAAAQATAAASPSGLPEPSATVPVPVRKTVSKAPPLAMRATKAGVRKPLATRSANKGTTAPPAPPPAAAGNTVSENSPEPQASLEPKPSPFTPSVPQRGGSSSASREGSQQRTPPGQKLQASQLHHLGLTPMDDEPITLMHLSLVHSVPVAVLRDWNPHLEPYGDEEAIPDEVAVTVPRAYGLEEEYEGDEMLDETLGTEDDARLPSSAMSRSRASTGTMRSSVGGSRVRENIKFVHVRDPSAPRASQHLPPPPHTVSAVDTDTAGAATELHRDDKANSSGLSTPMASPREWQPTPAPPPDSTALQDLRKRSEEPEDHPVAVAAPSVLSSKAPRPAPKKQQLQPMEAKVEGGEDGEAALAAKPNIRVLSITTAAPAAAATPPQPSPRKGPGAGKGRRKVLMPPPLNAQAVHKDPQNPSEVASSAAAAPGEETEHHGETTETSPDTRERTPHQQRMAKAQPPPLSASLVDRRKSASLSAPKDPLAAEVERRQQARATSPERTGAAKTTPPALPQPQQQPSYQRPNPRPALHFPPTNSSSSNDATVAFHPIAMQPHSHQHQPSATSFPSASVSRVESASGTPSFPAAATEPAKGPAARAPENAERRGAPTATPTPAEERVGRRLGLAIDGATLTVVRARGPAAKAGFRPGDAIRTVDGKAVHSLEEFASYIASGSRHAVFITVQEAGEGPVKTRHVVLAAPNTGSGAAEAEGEGDEAAPGRGAPGSARGRPLLPPNTATRSARATPMVRSASRGASAPVSTLPMPRAVSVGASARRPLGGQLPLQTNSGGVPPPPPTTAVLAASSVSPSRDASHVRSDGPIPTVGADAILADHSADAPHPMLSPPQSQRRALASRPAHPPRAQAEEDQRASTATTTSTAAAAAPARTRVRSRSAHPAAVVVPLGPARASRARSRKAAAQRDAAHSIFAPGKPASSSAK